MASKPMVVPKGPGNLMDPEKVIAPASPASMPARDIVSMMSASA